jgi:hypothetical protein
VWSPALIGNASGQTIGAGEDRDPRRFRCEPRGQALESLAVIQRSLGLYQETESLNIPIETLEGDDKLRRVSQTPYGRILPELFVSEHRDALSVNQGQELAVVLCSTICLWIDLAEL